ncbi:MAG: hypothetical protein CR991_09410 [Proteobacteria bacterium]|nr:MAG: hypothetical protein CR991_09410 [Pseudomonadota bacterium]
MLFEGLRSLTSPFICMILLNILASQTVDANQNTGLDPILLKKGHSSQYESPLMHMSDFVMRANYYEDLLFNKDFIKLQDIIARWWEHQTGDKQRKRIRRGQRLKAVEPLT